MPEADLPDRMRRIAGRFDRTDGPGFAVAVRRGGQTIYRGAFGLAEVATGRPNGCDVPMRIASLSKQFLCTAVMLLEAEGRLSIDDLLSDRMAGVPAEWSGVRLRHLMANASGMRDFLEMRLIEGGDFATAPAPGTSLDPVFAHPGLNFAPGSHFSYCNTGFALLTAIVEEIEAAPLEEVLARRIFRPLGMTRTALCRTDADVAADRALPYVEARGAIEPGIWKVPLDGAGGVVSTVDDLLLWAENLRRPRVGSAEIFERMSRPQTFADGAPSIYGLGLTTTTYRGQRTFGHHGQLPGVYAEIALFPDLDAAIVLIANTSDLNPFVLGRQIADEVLGPELSPGLPAPAQDIAGRWFCEETGQLFRIETGAGAADMSTAMMTAPLEVLPGGTMRMMWPMSMLEFRQTGPDMLAARDGQRDLAFRRITEPPAALPTGRWVAEGGTLTLAFDGADVAVTGSLGTLRLRASARGEAVVELDPPVEPVGRWMPHLVRRGEALVLTTDRTHAIPFQRQDERATPDNRPAEEPEA